MISTYKLLCYKFILKDSLCCMYEKYKILQILDLLLNIRMLHFYIMFALKAIDWDAAVNY